METTPSSPATCRPSHDTPSEPTRQTRGTGTGTGDARRSLVRTRIEYFLLGVLCTLLVVVIGAELLLPRVEDIASLTAWTRPAFWFLGGLTFLAQSALSRRDSRSAGRNRWSAWPLLAVVALGWFGMAISAIP
ncbi:hypothetical protein [Actinomyces polynesiensis]|uniref:hypothetical protein n=1 Tax=Actinomyces polynesiensis TaxID=1325934 RepID=UPI0005BA4AF1|nr:hypothetical protein [Actinomyces polynesiensis]